MDILRLIPDELILACTKRDLVGLLRGEQSIRMQMQEENDRLKAEKQALEEQVLEIEGQYVRIKNKIFGKSSERSPPPNDKPSDGGGNPEAKKKNSRKDSDTPTPRLPSERYPNVEVMEKELKLETLPECRSCGLEMSESGMSEVSEYIHVTPKKYTIIRQVRLKYRCQCHGDIQTTPGLPRIKHGSAYSDEMIIDIAASKYCDLIPIERYCAMASRQGFEGLPPNSLIEATHNLADFVSGAVEKVKQEILTLEVLFADETTHRMLEGDPKSNWYLWGFSGNKSTYFECHDTRSGHVASNILLASQCKVLLSDVFSGYRRAVRDTNKDRENLGLDPVENAYCNAHARRKFKEASEKFYKATRFYMEQYRKIYHLEAEAKDKPLSERLAQREKMMKPLFEEIKNRAESEINSFSSKSWMFKALNYFIKNYEGLTLFLSHPGVPIDNNAQERSLRNPVIGRKTWYGTHSRRGAETAAKLFTLIESCKLNKVNPRQYLQQLVASMHTGDPPFSPKEFSEQLSHAVRLNDH
jgi:transposase